MSNTSTLELLQQQFPFQLRLRTAQFAPILNRHPQSIRNSISLGRFKLHTYMEGQTRYVDVRDLANYLDGLRKKNAARGRPTKASLIEARAK